MRQSIELADERDKTATLVELTSAFEGIASMRIAKIKDQVLSSQQFFADLWKIYSQLRVDELFHFGRSQSVETPIQKELMILITSEGSFSGDIDQRLISAALKNYDPTKNAIVIVGHHGAVQLATRNVAYVRSFKTPENDLKINVSPIIAEVQKYISTVVYYQQYQSLMTQNIRSIKLNQAVTEQGSKVAASNEVIDEHNYIFEPSAYAVVDHLERSMMQITLSQVILESKLAQYASRFRAMSLAKEKSQESFDTTSLLYNRARRQEKDERLKELVNSLREVTL